MSAKYYCDICDVELQPTDHERIKRKCGILEIEVLRSVQGTWNGGHACHACILSVVNDDDCRTSPLSSQDKP